MKEVADLEECKTGLKIATEMKLINVRKTRILIAALNHCGIVFLIVIDSIRAKVNLKEKKIIFIINFIYQEFCKHTCGVVKGFKEGFKKCYVPRDYKKKPCEYVEDREGFCANQNNDCSNSTIRGNFPFVKKPQY